MDQLHLHNAYILLMSLPIHDRQHNQVHILMNIMHLRDAIYMAYLYVNLYNHQHLLFLQHSKNMQNILPFLQHHIRNYMYSFSILIYLLYLLITPLLLSLFSYFLLIQNVHYTNQVKIHVFSIIQTHSTLLNGHFHLQTIFL